MPQSLLEIIIKHIERNLRTYLWGLFSFVILSLFWDWMPTMVKVIALIIASIGFLYLAFTSNRTALILAYISKRRILCFILACIIIIPIEGFICRDSLISLFSKTPFENLVVTLDLYPTGIPDRYGILIEFGARKDAVDPAEITIDTGNVTPEKTWAWFDRPQVVFETPEAIYFNTDNATFLYNIQASKMPFTFGTIGMAITPHRSFYVRFSNPDPFTIEQIIYKGKLFHIEGDKLVADNP